MEAHQKYIDALVKLHLGLDRKGPGDTAYSNTIMSQIPKLPTNPRVADMGCGAGAGALFLANRLKSTVWAVDSSRQFLDELDDRATQQGLDHLIETVEGDMGRLGWKPESIDLLWSEGAAYNLTFAGALKTWRPLMAPDGIAVVSEMNYFTSKVPETLLLYMQTVYPAICTESENSTHAISSGFEMINIHRLPSTAWWENYYGPLKKNMQSLACSDDSIMQSVIKETEEEMRFFEAYEKYYGYSFYIMKAV